MAEQGVVRVTYHRYSDLVGLYRGGFLGVGKNCRSVVQCTRWEKDVPHVSGVWCQSMGLVIASYQ